MTEQILAVQKMQDYIEAHLTEDIRLSHLADVCSLSPWYAHRLFREYTGYAPAEYIRRIRLAQSALRLKTEEAKIIDVAYDLGFSSVDGYTRAFRKEFGINPREYAKNLFLSSCSLPTVSNSENCEREPLLWLKPKTYSSK